MDARVPIDEDVFAPEPGCDLLARHQIPSTLDQHQQEIHRLPPQSQLTPSATELVAGGVELEVPEAERHAGGGCPHECGGQYDVITR